MIGAARLIRRSLGHARHLVAIAFLLVALSAAPGSYAAEAPGALIDQTLLPGAPLGATAWHVRYRSTTQTGAAVDITGVVVVPSGAARDGRDVVSWAHGTVGVAERCAPSESGTLFQDIPGLPAMLRAEYIVAATDFQGLGTPGPHPYLVGDSSGRALIDIVRAARNLSSAHATNRVVFWGESQGGHASLWAAKIAQAYAPELEILGVAAAAPPTDLVANFDRITNPFIRALMTGYTSAAWSAVYRLDLASFANAMGRMTIRDLAQDCIRANPVRTAVDLGFLVVAGDMPAALAAPWAKVSRDNSVGSVPLGIPLLIAQGTDDPVVVSSVTRAFVDRSCRAGNTTRYLSIEGGGHRAVAARTEQDTLAWIHRRFANTSERSDCAMLTLRANEELGHRLNPGQDHPQPAPWRTFERFVIARTAERNVAPAREPAS